MKAMIWGAWGIFVLQAAQVVDVLILTLALAVSLCIVEWRRFR